MARDHEIVPDSQDEAELGDVELQLDRDITPPLARLPLIWPHPIPSNSIPRATSTISQYATDINKIEPVSEISQQTPPPVLNGPHQLSSISAFVSSDAPAKPRPRPRPRFSGSKVASDVTLANTAGDRSITCSSSPDETSHISTSQQIYAADISERIKARRAGIQSQVSTPKHVLGTSETVESRKKSVTNKKPVKPVAELIVTTSEDDDIMLASPRPPISEVTGNVEADSSSLKRNRDFFECDGRESSLSPVPEQAPKSKKKKVRKDDIVVANVPIVKHKKKSKETRPRSKATRAKANDKEKEGEPEQFKSREFILDSDDELTLGNGGNKEPSSASESSLVSDTSRPDVAQCGNSPLSPPPVSNVLLEASEITKSGDVKQVVTKSSSSEEPKKKVLSRKRKASENLDGENDMSSSEAALISKTVKATEVLKTSLEKHSQSLTSGETAPALMVEKVNSVARTDPIAPDVGEDVPKKVKKKKARMAKETNSAALPDPIALDVGNDVLKKATKKKTHKVVTDDNEKGMDRARKGEMSITLPLSPAEPPISTEPKSINSDPEEEQVSETPKKKARMAVIQEVQKENIKPINEISARTKIPRKPQTFTKGIYPHPPKNRSLSAVLQELNTSSPRPRASPAVSRTLLTRIVPLHPNRRTPPPPPPPRIIPKKTKKELEREEKWEEELQETIPGWCELEEGERDKMRRAKRDWELGLCEE